MAIQELDITGFRSLRAARWDPGRLNLVVGPNGSGKSNLIRCLELISNVAKGPLDKSLSDEGGTKDSLGNWYKTVHGYSS